MTTLYEYNKAQWENKAYLKHLGWITLLAILTIIIFFTLGIYIGKAHANEVEATIDYDIIKHIESSGNPNAYNKRTQAHGLYQITPIVLKEYNQFNKKHYGKKDLFDPNINKQIAKWYIEKRLKVMLKHFGWKYSKNNILISYNAGIGVLVKDKGLPKETTNYIKKYHFFSTKKKGLSK